ncbi:hypothetical protein GGI04_006091 [Coemansia thaxteri]|nr:hypothetical protein GGI04_006091 [Coemansia thaxteri]KAJ2457732.1 hypothetical protein GGI02_006095 [Coemansia sp. RSA 2322]
MIVTSGFFADYYLTPLFGWSLDGAPTATVYGDDNAKNSFTSLGDIAKYTIAAIKRIDEFENQNLRLAAYTLSFVDWCNLVEQEAGTRVKVAEADLAPIIEAAKLDIDPPKDLEAIKRQMAIVLANGAGKVDWETHSLDNSKFPEITPAPIELVVKQALAKALK